jgi:hypothetical protein
MTTKKATPEQLAEEVRKWSSRETTPNGWNDAPEAVPRFGESKQISIRLPVQMLQILKEFARRQGIGYQVLIKKWLDLQIRSEAATLTRSAKAVENPIDDRVTVPESCPAWCPLRPENGGR